MASTQQMQQRAKQQRQQAKLTKQVSDLSEKYGLTNVAFIRNSECVIAFAASVDGLTDTSHNYPAESAVGVFKVVSNDSFKTSQEMAEVFLLIGSALFKHCSVMAKAGKHYIVSLVTRPFDSNYDACSVAVNEVSSKEWQAAQL